MGTKLWKFCLNILRYFITSTVIVLLIILCAINLLFRQLTLLFLKCVYTSQLKLINTSRAYLFSANQTSNCTIILNGFTPTNTNSEDKDTQSQLNFEKLVETFEIFLFPPVNLESSRARQDELGLCWILKNNWLFSYWRKDKDFDTKNHFVFQQIEPNQNLQKETEKVVQIYADFDWQGINQPQWVVHVLHFGDKSIKNSENSSQFTIVVTCHHSYGDAQFVQKICNGFANSSANLKPAKSSEKNQIESIETQTDVTLWTKIKNFFNKVKSTLTFPHRLTLMTMKLREGQRQRSGRKGGRYCTWTSISSSPMEKIKGRFEDPEVMTQAIVMKSIVKAYKLTYESNKKECPANLNFASFNPKMSNFWVNLSLTPKIDDEQFLIDCVNKLNEISNVEYLTLNDKVIDLLSWLMLPILRRVLNRLYTPRISMTSLFLEKMGEENFEFGGNLDSNLVVVPPLVGACGASFGLVNKGEDMTVSVVTNDFEVGECPNFVETFLQFFNQQIEYWDRPYDEKDEIELDSVQIEISPL